MNPRLLAEEYRVRQFWGDHPSRRQFLDRIPEQSRAIKLALAQIDTEFEVEGMTPLDNESASSIDEESTFLNHLKQATSEISIPSPNIGKCQLKSLLGRGGC